MPRLCGVQVGTEYDERNLNCAREGVPCFTITSVGTLSPSLPALAATVQTAWLCLLGQRQLVSPPRPRWADPGLSGERGFGQLCSKALCSARVLVEAATRGRQNTARNLRQTLGGQGLEGNPWMVPGLKWSQNSGPLAYQGTALSAVTPLPLLERKWL